MAAHGQRYFNVALGMGSRCSASSLCVTSAAVAEAQSADGGEVIPYADDFLGVHQGARGSAAGALRRLEGLLSAVGLPAAPGKSVGPARSVEFVGLQFRAEARGTLVDVKPDTKGKIVNRLLSVTTGQLVDREADGKLVGRIYWAAQQCPPTRAWARLVARDVLPVSTGTRRGGRWSRQAVEAARALARFLGAERGFPVEDVAATAEGPSARPRFLLATDACGYGGGAVLVDLHDSTIPVRLAQFRWDGHILSSTRSELRTVLAAVRHFAPSLSGASVRLLSDNVAAVSTAGGFRSSVQARYADGLAEDLALVLHRLRVRLHAQHLRGVANICADRLSRCPSQVATAAPSWREGIHYLSGAARPFSRTRRPLSPASETTIDVLHIRAADGRPSRSLPVGATTS